MKQKKRQKTPAKPTPHHTHARIPPPPATSEAPHHESTLAQQDAASVDLSYEDNEPYDPGNEEGGVYYSEDEYEYPDEPNGLYPPQELLTGSKKTRKKRSKRPTEITPYHDHCPRGSPHGLPPPPPPPPALSRSVGKVPPADKDRIWNTSTEEERGRIKEFWLSLGEDERKALVKIEKEAVLRKMKEQQKTACSCTVCGRKRTAIEEELEVLYDAYYDELEQYAHSNLDTSPANAAVTDGRRLGLDEMVAGRARAMLPPPLLSNGVDARQHVNRIDPTGIVPHAPIRELDEAEDELDDEDLDEDDYSEDYDEDDDFSDDDLAYDPRDPSQPPGQGHELFSFGQHLTVKDGILTVADDLLKDDGKKFIYMMGQLAERRMAREEEIAYHAHAGTYSQPHHNHNQGPAPEEEEYDDEDDDDFDSQEGEFDEDEEDDMDTMTEEQRMQEGRRMFQIFAARMFEQRVLQAYREKVSRERQEKLLLELSEEEKDKAAKEAKKARDSQKKKDKRKAQQQAKAEEKAKRDAEIAEAEAAKKAEEEKKLEEQRRRREEQRLKKETEKKASDEQRAKKEAQKSRRQQEERDRQIEVERKAKESKAAEKKARDDAKRRERDERMARERGEKEEKQRLIQEAKEELEKRVKQMEFSEAKEQQQREEESKARAAAAAAQPTIAKRPAQSAAVSHGLAKQPAPSSHPSTSAYTFVAGPTKEPTPKGPKQGSRQTSHASSPRTPIVGPGKTTSPNHPHAAQNNMQPKQILLKPQPPQQMSQASQQPSPSSTAPVMPPPGMPFSGPPGFGGYLGQSPIMPGIGRAPPMGQMPPVIFPHQAPQMGGQYRGFPPLNSIAGPGGVNGASMMHPPGFGPPQPIGTPQLGNPSQMPIFPSAGRESLPSHSRQHSSSDKPFEKPYEPAPIGVGAPISRPPPIARPASVKPREPGKENATKTSSSVADADLEDLAQHLGSKALLAEDDEVETPEASSADGRRTSNLSHANSQVPSIPRATTFSSPFLGAAQLHSHPFSNTWGAPTPNMNIGAAPGLGGFGSAQLQAAWGASPPSAGWGGAFHSNHPFGPIGPGAGAGGSARSLGPGPGAIPLAHAMQSHRPSLVRKLIRQACLDLDKQGSNSPSQFHDLAQVHAKVDAGRPFELGPISAAEVMQTIDGAKAGNAQNGGGRFEVQRDLNTGRSYVKFVDDLMGGLTVGGAGEVASPTLGIAMPFGGLGAMGPAPGHGQGQGQAQPGSQGPIRAPYGLASSQSNIGF